MPHAGTLTELISVSFIEHLLPNESLSGLVVKLLGERMQEEHRRIFGIEKDY
jgi:hypothetical protein